MNDLFAYVPSVPGISWERVADVCVKTVKPVYHAVQRTLQDDLDDFAQFMVELEDRHLGDDDEVSVCEVSALLRRAFDPPNCPADCGGRVIASSGAT